MIKRAEIDRNESTPAPLNVQDTFSPVLDLDRRLHRLIAFALAFASIVLTLVLMSKLYKTINTLKYRNKHYGYYIHPKYETILVNLNRQIKSSISQNLKKTQFLRLRMRDEDEEDVEGRMTNGIVEETADLKSSRYESGYLNDVFQSDMMSNSVSEQKSSEEINEEAQYDDEEEEKVIIKREIIQNLVRRGRFTSSFSYRRLGKRKSKRFSPLTRCRMRTKRATKICSLLVRKLLKPSSRAKLNSIPISEPTSTLSRTVEFSLPSILVTDTASMNTIIIDLEEL